MAALPAGISIIIATYNRAEALRITLESLAQVEAPALPWELIIVNNNSTDHTMDVISEFAQRLPIVVLKETRLGKSIALNSAIPHGRYGLKLFTDDDILFDTQWLKAYERAMHDHPEAGYFGGPIHLQLPEGIVPDWAQDADGHLALWIRNSLSYLDETILKDAPGSYYGANMAVRQHIFDQHGVYDNNVGYIGARRLGGMETKLQARFAAAGVASAYVPDALIYHRIRPDEMTLQSRMNARLWVGRSRAKNNYLNGHKRLNLRRTLGFIRLAIQHFLTVHRLPLHEKLARQSDLYRLWGYEQQMWRMLFTDADLRENA